MVLESDGRWHWQDTGELVENVPPLTGRTGGQVPPPPLQTTPLNRINPVDAPVDPARGMPFDQDTSSLANSILARKKKIASYYAFGFGSTLNAVRQMQPIGGKALLTL